MIFLLLITIIYSSSEELIIKAKCKKELSFDKKKQAKIK